MRFANDYPANWSQIAADLKESVGWRCEHCGHPHDIASGYMLTVHHLNGDKSDCRYENLLACCQRCHLYLQTRFYPGQLPLIPLEWMLKRGLAY